MKKIFGLILAAMLAITACKDKDKQVEQEKVASKKSYKEQKESLQDREKKNPKEFLELTGDDKRNWLGKSVFKGVIKNTATQVAYKNIRVKTNYYKSDGTYVTNHEDTFEDEIKPGDTYEFKIRYGTPKGTDSVTAIIMSAEVSQ